VFKTNPMTDKEKIKKATLKIKKFTSKEQK